MIAPANARKIVSGAAERVGSDFARRTNFEPTVFLAQ
jgi:hypothetical protein